MRIFLILATIITALLLPQNAGAEVHFEMQYFKTLPILHEGREKPLSSFADIMLRQFSGREKLQNMNSSQWLAAALFDPQSAANVPVFTVPDKTLITKLKLDSAQDLYSYAQIQPALKAIRDEALPLFSKEETALTGQEKTLLRLYENTALFTALLRSFTALLPLDLSLPPAYQDQIDGALNFTELLKVEKQLEQDLTGIITRKGRDPSKYTPRELTIAKASFHLQTLRAGAQDNELLRIIPVQWEDSKDQWATPWTIMLQGQGGPGAAFLLSQWTDLAGAYRQNDAPRWKTISEDILEETLLQNPQSLNIKRLKIEQLYRAVHPYTLIITLYGLSIFAATFLLFKQPTARLLRLAPTLLALTGIVLHIVTLTARIYILQRPPVGTLYESILFVTLICAALGILLQRARTSFIPLITGTGTAAALLICAPVFKPDGDSLEVLAAVLNTNFWLTVHVLCITAGYGVCILAAMFAHSGLYISGFKHNKELSKKLRQNVYRTSIAALLLTAIGTALGGIWADQSWGRFWGWDPKENGALLIVLWLIWVQHGRISKHLSSIGFMAMSAALNIIVAISWFGVNLLNVGLHSYGFTSGLAGSLIAFCIAEIALITFLYIAAKKQECAA